MRWVPAFAGMTKESVDIMLSLMSARGRKQMGWMAPAPGI